MTRRLEFRETNYFSTIICDYLDGSKKISDLYGHCPDKEGLFLQTKIKEVSFSERHRGLLCEVLEEQYRVCATSQAVKDNIHALKSSNTFTVTTGHQLNLFTGPLYFFYKIITAIQTAKALNEWYPNYNFVPVYWMATEDHDFDEINHFTFCSKSFFWPRNFGGAVGAYSTKGLDKVFKLFSQELKQNKNSKYLKELFENSYIKHTELTTATRYLVNHLFETYGLVIIDGNAPKLKASFKSHIIRDFTSQYCYKAVSQSNIILKQKGYTPQAFPRQINFFYLLKGSRRRVVQDDKRGFLTLDGLKHWSFDELLKEIDDYPERFSPNVLMRPLYQEVVLPNICYIGGGGELAYWMQLKSFFDTSKVPFPVLMLRHSALLMTDKQHDKIQKLNLEYKDLFLPKETFIRHIVNKTSHISIDLSPQKETLKHQFQGLYNLAKQTDSSFLGAVKAQERKQIQGLEHLEKRLLKAQKRVLSDQIERSLALKNILFPNESLQERSSNFSEFYLRYGDEFIPRLMKNMKSCSYKYLVI